MKTLTAEVIAEKAASTYTPVYFIRLGTLYITTRRYQTTFLSNTYIPMPIDLGDGFRAASGGPLDEAQIRVGCLPDPPSGSPLMSSVVLNGTIDSAPAYVYKAYLNSYATMVGYEVLYCGRVNGRPGIEGSWAVVRLEPLLATSRQVIGRVIRRQDFPWMLPRGKKMTLFNTVIEFISPGTGPEPAAAGPIRTRRITR